ncbi:MAG TPA: transposase [Verrucomicrobiae bacterium]|nr:transposase [Verrucomicrobiae bacterium]
MARKLRLQYPGAIYHAMNRGDRREPIFLDDLDRHQFIDTLGQACEKTDWQVHAWCLMNNHFHLVVCWSSYPLYLQEPSLRPSWLRVDRLLGEWGIPKDSTAGRGQLAGLMEARRRAEGLGEYQPKGWYLGSEEFRQELLAQVEHQAGPRHVGEEVFQSAQGKAERIVSQELRALRWGALELERHPKGHPAKVKIAARLRNQTTMTLDWIADRLCMGSAGDVSHLLYRKHRCYDTAMIPMSVKISYSDPHSSVPVFCRKMSGPCGNHPCALFEI